MALNVGFIGLGSMGRPLAINIREAGFDLVAAYVLGEAVLDVEHLPRGLSVAAYLQDSDGFVARLRISVSS